MQGRIGIRREDKDMTEKRASLTPKHVEELVSRHGIEVFVRPSPNRIFTENEYAAAGATISDDLSSCRIVFGVKEIPEESLRPEQAYCFFSHTIKGQSANMAALQQMLDLQSTLIDYEKMTDRHGNRLVMFGEFAGYAGMIDSLWVLGKRLQYEGLETPFLHLKQTLHYESLSRAKDAVRRVGELIRAEGLPGALGPVICGFTGGGHVSSGAQEIFDLLEPVVIEPEELEPLTSSSGDSRKSVFKTRFRRRHRVAPIDPAEPYDRDMFVEHPERFEACFEQYVPYLTVLINGIYWEPGQPRLISKRFLNTLYEQEKAPRLRVVGDITNDTHGSIEFNVQSTTVLEPVYVYEPLTRVIRKGWEGHGPVVLAVDKLPTELPREASAYFGDALFPFVTSLANADYTQPFDALDLDRKLLRAVIAHHGALTPNFDYLQEHLV